MINFDAIQWTIQWWTSVEALPARSIVTLVNMGLSLVNLLVIISVIITMRKFRKRVSVQDASRIAYLEEFKVYVKNFFTKLDSMAEQLDRIENRQRGQKCGCGSENAEDADNAVT